MHPTLTPLADDVDFRKLAETYEVSGGDIRNAVLKAALAAATTPQHDTLKLIHHHHLDEGIREVIAGRKVMRQSLFKDAPAPISGDAADRAAVLCHFDRSAADCPSGARPRAHLLGLSIHQRATYTQPATIEMKMSEREEHREDPEQKRNRKLSKAHACSSAGQVNSPESWR